MKDDAISRQGVLKLLSTMPPEEAITKAMLIQNVKYMSAAQPEKRTEERTEKHACDCISRQAAIEAIKEDKIDLTNPNVVAVFKYTGDFEKVGTQVMTCDRHIEIIKDLPSVQPDSLVRPSARWMSVGHKSARICSRCFRDEPYKFADHDADVYDFCPHCGADMREGE